MVKASGTFRIRDTPLADEIDWSADAAERLGVEPIGTTDRPCKICMVLIVGASATLVVLALLATIASLFGTGASIWTLLR